MRPSSNRLADATSPYLQQHAGNPVDWWPWCEEALATARREDKPILLSIGYSACHWCHVMAHESFEDPETARVMNGLFVNIKVDREERPDLDKIYQSAHQLLSGRPGGWPLTVVLTPDDQVPFFAGTYFPKTPHHRLPGFQDLLQRVAQAYREQQTQIREQNRSMLEALGSLSSKAVATRLDGAPLEAARDQLAQSYDSVNGGFGQAPKFPHVTGLERLLRHWAANAGGARQDRRALDMAVHTLARMAEGGIYDQVGGGFCRYSVDDQWMIPHFEKMLYDNGPLLVLYCDAWLATGQALFRRTADGLATWVIREMQSPEGAYYSTLDADSEGEEGKFYVWDRNQVRALLDESEYALIRRRYGLDQTPNFEGSWHLHGFVELEAVAQEAGVDPETTRARIDAGLEKLFRAREKRIRPGRDEKILTAWNALMIKGMARAARVFQRPEWLGSAERALTFLHRELWRDGRLLATHKDGRSHLAAYLDDYAFLIDALLELLQTRWKADDLNLAVELAEVLLAHFEDPKDGGFFFTANDHERLIHRPKPLGDESTPASNGIAAQVLQRLGYLLGEPRYLEAAEHTLKYAWRHMSQVPYAHASLLTALEEYLEPPEVVILRGKGAELERWQRAAQKSFAPRRLVLAIPNDSAGLPDALAAKAPRGEAVAYVCSGEVCEAPIENLGALEERLGADG